MYRKLVFFISVFLVCITTIAYSALSTSLTISSEARIRPLADIRVNGITINSSSDATMQYESDYSRDTIYSGFILPSSSSSISYTVHIDNFGDVDYAIYDVLNVSSSNPGLNISVSGYNMRDIIQAKTSIDLVVTYTTSQPSNDVISVISKFDFREVYHISYVTGTQQVIAEQIKYAGVNLILTNTVPTKGGYVFSNWNTRADGTGVNYSSGATYTLDEDKILYAQYTMTNYNITYNLNNGTLANSNPATYNIESQNITLNNPTKTITFVGNYNSSANAASGEVTIGANTSQAQPFEGWTGSNGNVAETTVTIATGSFGDKSYTAHYESTAAALPTVTRNGYTCGWNTSSTGTTIEYSNTFPASAITDSTATTINLYAVCTPTTYTVTADANGGSISSTTGWSGTGNSATKSVTYDSTYGTLPTVSRTNYELKGWSLLPSGYTPVEYIQSSGTQYIDTGVPANTVYGLDFQYMPVGNDVTYASYLSGALDDFTLGRFNSETVAYVRYRTAEVTRAMTVSTSSVNTLSIKNGLVKGNSNQHSVTTTSPLSNASDNLFIFNNSSLSRYSKLRVYSLVLYNSNNQAIRYFIPCINDSTGKAGLYDLINGTFYGNGGTGDFTVGNESYLTSSTIVKLPKNHTITAKWRKTVFTITYATNNGTVSSPNPTEYRSNSATITLNNPTKTLTFKGNPNATSGANAASGTVTIGANTSQAQPFAGWTGSNDLSSGLSGYTISSPYNAAARDHILGNDFNVTSGTTYRVFITAKKTAGSLNLQGGLWYTAQTEGNAYDGYSGTFTYYSDAGNGWAKYYKDVTVPTGKTKAKFYVQLDQTSSAGFTTAWSVADMHVIVKNAAVTIPTGSSGDKSYEAHYIASAGTLPTVTRSGYACGWNTSSTGTTIQYFSGATFPASAISESMSSTVNLYAVCVKDPVITYNLNSDDMNTWAKQYAERFSISYNSNTKLSTVSVAGSGGWEIIYIPLTTVSGKTYTFTFDYQNPNGYTALSGYSGIGAQAITAVANSHNSDSQLAITTLPTAASSTTTSQTLTFTATGTTTYIAFNFGMAADGVTTKVLLGNFKLVETLRYGNTLGNSVTPVPKIGYTFNGWYTAASGGSQVTSSTSVPASNTTYYAHYTVNSYTVTCEDWFVDASNNRKTKIGTAGTASYNYNTTVSGSAWGSDGTLSKYYTHYAYKGSSSAVVTTSGATVYRYFWAWNNINVLNPAGSEKTDGSVAKFSVSYNGASYIANASNEDGNKIILPWGATIQIKDIAMQQSYYLLDSVTWGSTTLTASNGVYTATVSTSSMNLNVKTKYQSYYVDLNGYLDNANNGGLSSFGTADVYINGTQVANDVTDYYTQWPYGSTYEFKDIKATTGHKYNGVREGSLSGTVTGNVNTRLNFSTKTVVVTFKPNGGSGSDTTQTFTYGVANQSFSAKGYTRSGWTQGNWAESASGSGVYSILSGVSDAWIDSKSPSITLYATWRDTTNPSVSAWANVAFSGTRINTSSTASTTIIGVGSDGQSGLAKLQYYTTCNSGTATASSSNPSEATITNGNASITVNKCNRPTLYYRTKDNAGNVSGWVSGGALAERLMYAQYYNYLMYYGGTASNNDSNLGSFVNSSNTVHANIGAMIDNGATTTAINGLSNNDFVYRAYRSILGRDPGSSEVSGQVNALNNGTTRKGLLHQFEDSSESTSIKSGWGY